MVNHAQLLVCFPLYPTLPTRKRTVTQKPNPNSESVYFLYFILSSLVSCALCLGAFCEDCSERETGLSPSSPESRVPEAELSRQASGCTGILGVTRRPGFGGKGLGPGCAQQLLETTWGAVAVAMERRSSRGQTGVCDLEGHIHKWKGSKRKPRQCWGFTHK